MTVRIDKWLWAIRVYKTRSLAADACKANRISVNGQVVKPSREVKEGDVVTVKRLPVVYTYKVLEAIHNRQPAKNVPLYAENLTPQSELDKLTQKVTVSILRDPGTGRPTKKERRDIDDLMDSFYDDLDEDIE